MSQLIIALQTLTDYRLFNRLIGTHVCYKQVH